MKKLTIKILIVSLAIVVPTTSLRAQMATMDEALIVASNWIEIVMYNKGAWGNFDQAYVEEIQDFNREGRVIGYFCQVYPQGFIVISLRKELAPVKAYSATSDLDPTSEKGLVDVIKGGMERVLDAVEQEVGPIEAATSQQVQNVLEINYRPAWEEMEVDLNILEERLKSAGIEMNYQEGEVLLSTAWDQGDPYNRLCPTGDTGCTDCCPDDPWTCNPTQPTLVGCVATAGSQIMKHWNWPPYGVTNHSYTWDGDDSCNGPVGGEIRSATFSDTYDWVRMANRYIWDAWQDRWEDEDGNPLAQANLNAMAELCYEVGVAVNMDYGVCGSGAFTDDMENVYETHYRYSTDCARRNRDDYSAVGWFNLMKANFDVNRPVHYKISGHSIVSDGWQEVIINQVLTKQYHMNYGWGEIGTCQTGCNTWYTLDAHLWYDYDEDYLLENIYPKQALGKSLVGNYPPVQLFPYRYFDRDATGDSVTFQPGQHLQFLRGIKVTCTSTTGNYIRFQGTSSNNIRLFSIKATRSASIKIIDDGALRLYQNGSLKFH